MRMLHGQCIARSGALFACALLAACSTPPGPKYARPALALPEKWSLEAPGATLPAKWWTIFRDPQLDALVEEALVANRDVAAAAARVAQARAGLELVDAGRYPSASADPRAARTRATQSGSMPLPASVAPTSNSLRFTFGAAYEIDFFGRYARSSEAARAELLGSEAARDAVRLALTAEVVRAHYELLSLQAREQTALRALDTRERGIELQRKRLEAGVISEFELKQVEAEREAARSQIAALRQQKERQSALLGLLLGRDGRRLWEEKLMPAAAADPFAALPPRAVPAGLPSQLLERRPDIRQAEQQLVAANARIGLAQVAYFPTLSLTGYLGKESAALSSFLATPAGIAQMALAAGLTLFDAGRRDAQVEQARARRQEALAQYERAVQAAFVDTRAALAAQSAALETFEAESARASALRRALELARLRYENGITSQLEVLDAERNLLAAELARLDALAAQRAAVVDLVKALGGGWEE